MTPVKKASKKADTTAAEAVKAVAEKVEETVAEETKSAKKATKKVAATAKKTTEKVAETAKKASTTVKKAAAKKAPAKKELSHENTSVTIEFAGRQVAAKEVVAKAKAAFEAAHEGVEVKTLELYIKPEENVAYYVVNGEGADDFKVEL